MQQLTNWFISISALRKFSIIATVLIWLQCFVLLYTDTLKFPFFYFICLSTLFISIYISSFHSNFIKKYADHFLLFIYTIGMSFVLYSLSKNSFPVERTQNAMLILVISAYYLPKKWQVTIYLACLNVFYASCLFLLANSINSQMSILLTLVGSFMVYYIVSSKQAISTQIKANENLLRAIFQAANGGLILYDITKDTITKTNQYAKNLLKTNQEVLLKFIKMYQANTELATGELLLQQDGEEVWVKVSIKQDIEHVEDLLLINIADITNLKNTNAALQQSNDELRQFAYVASHDLREPLRMISSYLGLISRRYEDKLDQSGKEFIAFAVDGAQRMDTLIKDLLRYSRVNKQSLKKECIKANKLVKMAMDNLGMLIYENEAEITIDELPTIKVNQIQFAQLLQNLISNAIKYRKSTVSPKVHVTAKQLANQYQFTISDNGIGIAEENYDRIFQVFQRLHDRSQYQGTGLGLAICKKIVEGHKGKIWVESNVNEGTKFHFTLPI